MRGRTAWRLQSSGLAAVALVVASWANGLDTIFHLIVAAMVGAAIGWIVANWVPR
jgi:hypothetical protein